MKGVVRVVMSLQVVFQSKVTAAYGRKATCTIPAPLGRQRIHFSFLTNRETWGWDKGR